MSDLSRRPPVGRQRAVQAFLATLSRTERLVLQLVAHDGMTYAEISELLSELADVPDLSDAEVGQVFRGITAKARTALGETERRAA